MRIGSLNTSAVKDSDAVGVTIGNFDGMHLGHQALFSALKTALQPLAQSQNKRAFPALLTFAPHPRRVFSGLSREAKNHSGQFLQITSLRKKAELAAYFGFEAMIVQRFHPSFYQISPDEFIDQYLLGALNAKVVVIGEDWSFGKGRQGNAEMLRDRGDKLGFEVIVVRDVTREGIRVSSSVARRAIEEGRLNDAEQLLGRRFAFSGIVRHGHKRGRALGFPTANLRPLNQLLPPDGVYASVVRFGGNTYPAATSIGVRPVFESRGERLVEVYIMSEQVFDLYHQRIDVELVEFVRPELSFDSAQTLVNAMRADIEQVHRILSAKN